MIQSNKFQLIFLKHILIFIGIVIIIAAILKFYNPDYITDWTKLTIFSTIGIILIALNFIIYEKFKLVKVSHQKLMYLDKLEWKEVKWTEIDEIYRVRFISPPIYRAKIKTTSQILLFPTESSYNHTEINGGPFQLIIDHSKMGEIIKKAKTDYGI